MTCLAWQHVLRCPVAACALTDNLVSFRHNCIQPTACELQGRVNCDRPAVTQRDGHSGVCQLWRGATRGEEANPKRSVDVELCYKLGALGA
jgi:hypothetical protein